jgi:hypothetical protein
MVRPVVVVRVTRSTLYRPLGEESGVAAARASVP